MLGKKKQEAITYLLSPPASALLCHDRRVTLGTQNIHHEGIGGKNAGFQHGEDSGITAGYQRNALVVDLDGLLLITACHIPEHHLGQLVAMFLEEPLRILEVGQGAIFSTVVELHIGDNEDLGRHILLGHTVLHGSLEDQLKHTLDIGVGDLVELVTVPHLFVDILALNLHQLGILRECDEVVLECAGVALGIVDTKRQRHSGGDGISTTVHGAGAINDDQSVLTASEILLCLPCCVNGLALLIGDIAATEEGLDHLIGRQGASVELLRTLGDTAHEFIIAVSIISHEGLTILEHGLGGLLGVIEGVVFFAQVVLDDADLGAQGAQRFAVLGVVHSQ